MNYGIWDDFKSPIFRESDFCWGFKKGYHKNLLRMGWFLPNMINLCFFNRSQSVDVRAGSKVTANP